MEYTGGLMNTQRGLVAGMIAVAALAALPGISAPMPNAVSVPAEIVITVRLAPNGSPSENLEARDLTVSQGNDRVSVTSLQRLEGDLAGMQLFIFLDDSTGSSSLGAHLPELKAFLGTLPTSTQTAVGYMRNGTFALAQSFTTDRQQAASALRLPNAMPGENGSPYFALTDLVKHWPSKESTGRRAVLMLTDGVDRYYGTSIEDDPYVDAASHEALKEGVTVYSIYLRGAGVYGQSDWVTNVAQSRLEKVSEETGGSAYFEGFRDPVTISPFLNDFHDRLESQYKVTVEALNHKGVQPVKVRTELPRLKIDGPTRICVQ
jgi:hypothetical protein